MSIVETRVYKQYLLLYFLCNEHYSKLRKYHGDLYIYLHDQSSFFCIMSILLLGTLISNRLSLYPARQTIPLC